MTKSMTAAELCQLVQDAHGRIAASVVTTRWGLSLEMELPNRFQPSVKPTPKKDGSIPSLISIYPMHSLPKDGAGECFGKHRFWANYSQWSFQEQRTGSFKLRGAHSKLSKMKQGEVENFFSYFCPHWPWALKMWIMHWRQKFKKNGNGSGRLGDLKLRKPWACM